MEILGFQAKEKAWNREKTGGQGEKRMASLPYGQADYEKANSPHPFEERVSLLICCVTLEKIFNFFDPQSFNCKTGTMMPTLWEYWEE